MEKSELAVGDSTRLEIIFSTKKYQNRITKSPRIVTNEGPPDKRVQIVSEIVARPDSTYPLIMKPYKLDLTQFGDKVRDEIEFQIENVSDAELSLLLVSSDPRFFTLELPDKVGPGKSVTAKLKLVKETMDANFEKSLTIECSDQNKSRFTIPVKRTLRPAVHTESSDH